jgi:hypothetical protein
MRLRGLGSAALGSMRRNAMAIACGYRKNNEAASLGGLIARP